jgi:hypothetical protein
LKWLLPFATASALQHVNKKEKVRSCIDGALLAPLVACAVKRANNYPNSIRAAMQQFPHWMRGSCAQHCIVRERAVAHLQQTNLSHRATLADINCATTMAQACQSVDSPTCGAACARSHMPPPLLVLVVHWRSHKDFCY